jgi:hypothetical protein
LFTIKGNLVFMNNFYHKVALASVCTALGFVGGASEEAYSATFTLPPAITFEVIDGGQFSGGIYDGLGDEVFPGNFDVVYSGPNFIEAAEFAEFNIASFSVAPNTLINSAIFQAEVLPFSVNGDSPYRGSLGIFGYVGNGTAEASDFEAGVFLSSVYIASSFSAGIINFDVTQFVNQRVTNGDAFAGFGIRALNEGGLLLANNNFDGGPKLIVETGEPVPEPTTIFGSAIALGLGGWLKRKNSSQQNKTKSQG